MEETLLTKEEQESVAIVLDAIQKYESGDESFEEDIIDIIGAIWDFTKFSKKIKVRYNLIIKFYKFISRVTFHNDEYTKSSYASIDKYYNFYVSASETLKRYVDIGFKTDEYPDLEAAYLLTVYLTNLELNINDYLNEISSIERSVTNGYTYYGSSKLESKCEERYEVVKKLVESINPEKRSYE